LRGQRSQGNNISHGRGILPPLQFERYRVAPDTEFSGREVKIGTHRTAPPDGSIGDWIKGRFKLGGIMSYLGVVLVEEGYAERCSKLDRIRINKYPATR